MIISLFIVVPMKHLGNFTASSLIIIWDKSIGMPLKVNKMYTIDYYGSIRRKI